PFDLRISLECPESGTGGINKYDVELAVFEGNTGRSIELDQNWKPRAQLARQRTHNPQSLCMQIACNKKGICRQQRLENEALAARRGAKVCDTNGRSIARVKRSSGQIGYELRGGILKKDSPVTHRF